MKAVVLLSTLAVVSAISVSGFAQSPAAEASVSVAGKTITIKYAAPSVRGRKIFGDGGRLSQDPNYPVWRAGANSATAFHTDADLEVKGLQVPKGDYTLYVLLSDPDQWQLIISKKTGQWGLSYDHGDDLGRVKMDMSKPPAPVETLKYTLSSKAANKAVLQLEWENYAASVPIAVK